jgi:hypothetical protein
MRLWTLHPCYLDAQGLVALWREALLAQKVLQGATRGYQHHPQLARFRAAPDPAAAIASFLSGVLMEAQQRGYAFDGDKIGVSRLSGTINATQGQLLYEWRHLKRKLQARDPARGKAQRSVKLPIPHPLFQVVAGAVEDWERVV